MGSDTEISIEGYAHVAIVVDDLEAARGFWVGLLGLAELPRPDLGVPGMWLRLGDRQLHFIENAELPIAGPGFPHLAVQVAGDRWDGTIGELRARGAEFLMGPSQRDDFGVAVRSAFLRDPAGNVVELTDVGPFRD